ncbi:chemotaxis protein histidine kinase-like protein [Xenococcus sp. PCC 7305]|uniref:hybrid sensor histidine kinase/response regulator n=1 Tax=Xenococcus sp. PCC 7305 TaxID=102125 RepID=UPI0002AC9503|nr:hybrid sensor histidine kinase/response regulator [Xenococcus sp. PCC 7305]ELS02741.1 chemotaxis protein histidine kinase-like protein [Xenococcus sp. PCC 7305]
MFIEDTELRELYKIASADHLEKIENGLIHLEKNPNDQDKLEELLRATHSLKGDSRMLGVEEAEMLVHQMEDLLSDIKENNSVFTSNLCDRLYHGLDAVRKIAREAVTGESSGISTFHVMAQLMGAEDGADPDSVAASQSAPETPEVNPELLLANEQEAEFPAELLAELAKEQEAMAAAAQEKAQQELAKAAQIEDHQIETVRIGFPKLDALMTQAGELSVTKLRLARRTEDLREIINLWEDWSRAVFATQLSIKELEQHLTSETLEPIQKFEQLNQEYLEQLGERVTQLKNVTVEDNARLEIVAHSLETGIRDLRLLPLANVFNLFPRMIRDLAKQLGKEINLKIEGGDIAVDKRILEEIKDPLTHLIRNAIDHGIETTEERIAQGKSATANLSIRGYQNSNSICIEVIDDGRGLDTENIKSTALRRGLHTESELAAMTTEQAQSLIFASGFSTRIEVSEISGRGVGLDVVRANIERLKGSIQVSSTYGKGCQFQLTLKTSLSTTHILIVEVNRSIYAIPVDFIDSMLFVERDDIFQVEGTPTITVEGEPLSISWLSSLLKLPKSSDNNSMTKMSCVILKSGNERLGVIVDRLVDQQHIILKPQSKLLRRIPNISGATILGTGEICMVLNPKDLLQTALQGTAINDELSGILTQIRTKPKVLLVEDSLPIRTQVRRILDSSGYDVTVAVDGLDGFQKLQAADYKNFQAIVSDVEMPNLSGLEMTARIRQDKEYNELPIILVTTLAKESDKRRGADAGANAYLTKGDFDQTVLLDTLRRLI